MRRAAAKTALLVFLALGTRPGAMGAPDDDVARLVQAGRLEEAAREAEKQIGQDPKNPGLHLSQGLIFQSLGKYKDAVRSLEKAVQLAPDSAVGYYSLALVHEAVAFEAGRPSAKRDQSLHKARRAWEKVVALAQNRDMADTARRHIAEIEEEWIVP